MVLLLGDGTLATVADPAAIDVHPLEDPYDYNRYVIHSRFNAKLPIAIFDSQEFNVRAINQSRLVILAIRPEDGEGEIFYYGIEFPSLAQRTRLVSEAVDHANRDIPIPKELDQPFIVHFCSEVEVPHPWTPPNVKRGHWLVDEFVR